MFNKYRLISMIILLLLETNYYLICEENKWINTGPEGGIVWTINFLKSDPTTIFLGTYGGGFYKTTSGGNTWNLKGSNVLIRNYLGKSITAIKILENEIYIGSTLGLFKSKDFGEHWESIFEPPGCTITAIAINQEQPDIIYISNYAAGGGDFTFYNGISKSADGGKSWTSINEGLTSLQVYDCKMTSFDPDLLYAATKRGIFKNTTGGSSEWQNISGNLPEIPITSIWLDTTDVNILYVGSHNGIYNTTDGGVSWTNLTGSNFKNRFIRLHALSVKKNVIFAGTQRGLYKSTNHGKTWEEKNQNLENIDIYSISIVDEQIIYLGTADGVYKSINSGNNWIKKNQGMDEIGAIYTIVSDPLNSEIIYAGTQFRSEGLNQGIYKSLNGGENWEFISTGLPTYFFSVADICINPINPNTIFAVVSWEGIYKSLNNGRYWFEINGGIQNKIINSVTIDPTDTSRIYAAGEKIYMSENGGENWQEMMNGLPGYFGIINKIRIDPNDSRLIYAATNGYGVLKYQRKPTSVENNRKKQISKTYVLHQNYPNPFNPETEIRYEIPKSCKVVINIFNIKGEKIKTLVNEIKMAGNYAIKWDGFNETDERVSSGIYLCQMVSDNFRSVKKMVLAQ